MVLKINERMPAPKSGNEKGLQVRGLNQKDGLLLGDLFFDAYQGTVDDEGETVEQARMEANATLKGEYGSVIWEASFVLAEQDRMAGVSLITLHENKPLLAFSAVKKVSQRSGVASCLIAHSVTALSRDGYDSLRLFVTKTNSPATALYRKLAFKIEDANNNKK